MNPNYVISAVIVLVGAAIAAPHAQVLPYDLLLQPIPGNYLSRFPFVEMVGGTRGDSAVNRVQLDDSDSLETDTLESTAEPAAANFHFYQPQKRRMFARVGKRAIIAKRQVYTARVG